MQLLPERSKSWKITTGYQTNAERHGIGKSMVGFVPFPWQTNFTWPRNPKKKKEKSLENGEGPPKREKKKKREEEEKNNIPVSKTLQSVSLPFIVASSCATHVSWTPVTSQGIHSRTGTVTVKWGEPTLLFNPMKSLIRPMRELRTTVRRPIANRSSLRRTRRRRGPRS